MDEVNARLPVEEQFGWAGWYYSKSRRLIKDYRRLYPKGLLVRQKLILLAVAIFFLGTAVLQLGMGFGMFLFFIVAGIGLLWLSYGK